MSRLQADWGGGGGVWALEVNNASKQPICENQLFYVVTVNTTMTTDKTGQVRITLIYSMGRDLSNTLYVYRCEKNNENRVVQVVKF